jgi:threonyl-tRNA synthetase
MASLEDKRHTLAHLLAAAVLDLYPDAKRTIGPAIDNGFYFDFEFPTAKLLSRSKNPINNARAALKALEEVSKK